MAEYHVDPRSRTAPNVITQSELKVSSEPLADLIVHAREEIDRLYAIVRQQGYVVLLCNEEGVAIHHRGDEARAEEFKKWGIWLGGVGCTVMCLVRMPMKLSASKGTRPVKASYMMTPIE